jgi:hypothetical protein
MLTQCVPSKHEALGSNPSTIKKKKKKKKKKYKIIRTKWTGIVAQGVEHLLP